MTTAIARSPWISGRNPVVGGHCPGSRSEDRTDGAALASAEGLILEWPGQVAAGGLRAEGVLHVHPIQDRPQRSDRRPAQLVPHALRLGHGRSEDLLVEHAVGGLLGEQRRNLEMRLIGNGVVRADESKVAAGLKNRQHGLEEGWDVWDMLNDIDRIGV